METTAPRTVYEFGRFRADPHRRTLHEDTRAVALTPKAFDLLLVLLRRSSDVVSKDELMQLLWPRGFVEEGNLSQNVFLLRKALGDTAQAHRYVVTLPGRGYRFVAPVRAVAVDAEEPVAQPWPRAAAVAQDEDSSPIAEPAERRSLAALRAFAEGEAQRARGADFDAASSYRLAIDLDPDFAIAYARLARIHLNAQQHEAGERLMARAYELRHHASERDRLYIAAHHYAGRGELDNALQAYRLWRDLYPKDVVPANNLVEIHLSLGEPAKAAERARDAAALAPDNPIVLANLVRALRRNGEWQRARELCDELAARGLDTNVVTRLERMLIALIEGDDAEIDRQSMAASGTTHEAELLNEVAVIATSRGQGRAARALFERATLAARRSGLAELEALFLQEYAEYAAVVGEAERAQSHIQRALDIGPVVAATLASAARVHAALGDLDRAEALMVEAARRFPSDFALHRMLLPLGRAIVHLKRGACDAALGELRAVEPFDLSWRLEFESIYWRGACCLEAGRAADAAVQFERLLDCWTFRPDSHFIALARVGLARAHAAQGEREAARAEYERFFAAWSDADRDTPLLVTARAEHARLGETEDRTR